MGLQGGEALVQEARRCIADGGGLYLIRVKRRLWSSLEVCGGLDDTGAQRIPDQERDNPWHLSEAG